jgi:hypothetical protein
VPESKKWFNPKFSPPNNELHIGNYLNGKRSNKSCDQHSYGSSSVFKSSQGSNGGAQASVGSQKKDLKAQEATNKLRSSSGSSSEEECTWTLLRQ